MQKDYLYVANWKMYFSHAQALQWYHENMQDLEVLSNQKKIVICPSFDALASLGAMKKGSLMVLGAQNCSEHRQGAYTGQVSAQSLQECGVNYCIIGHSEMRALEGNTNERLQQKLLRLKEVGIIPIFCIGESRQDYENNVTEKALRAQLEPILNVYTAKNSADLLCYIAYEPLWAIGTGVVAQGGHISAMLGIVKDVVRTIGEQQFKYLYGGTVTSQTITTLKLIEHLDGFLIGKASTNFQELKKIVV